jgi:hypothetical protein
MDEVQKVRKFGGFILEKLIGKGAFGEVYLAGIHEPDNLGIDVYKEIKAE